MMEVLIVHSEEICEPCRYRRRGICYLFGELHQHSLENVDYRHPECVKRAEPLEVNPEVKP